MTLGAPIQIEKMLAGSCWQLCSSVNGYVGPRSSELATQAASGRHFQLINGFPDKTVSSYANLRIEVSLLEDGYRCWFDLVEIFDNAFCGEPWSPILLNQVEIQQRIPDVLCWLGKAALLPNQYLWGGTLGPNFDCSGLVQSAFASQDIWLPRDAYQQEKFCQKIDISIENLGILKPGDLLFFGSVEKCTHVGICYMDGSFCHCSGIEHGHNGIGFDRLEIFDRSSVACHYLSQLRGAGRVIRCHDGLTLP